MKIQMIADVICELTRRKEEGEAGGRCDKTVMAFVMMGLAAAAAAPTALKSYSKYRTLRDKKETKYAVVEARRGGS